jgi:apolipoprotein N-acyltransferase
LLGYAGLLWLLDRAEPARPRRSAFLRGWLAGVGYFAISIWWVGEAFFVDAENQAWMAPFAVVGLAGGLALFWAAAALAYRLVPPGGPGRVLVFAGTMAAAEWLRGNLLTGFPWDLPGETWRAGSAPSQLASIVGAYGLTWITVAIAAAAALGWRTRGARVALGLAALSLAGLYGFGAWRLATAPAAPAADAPIVRIVQPDTPERASYDMAAFNEILRRNLALTRRPAREAPAIVVWSEAGLPDALDDYLATGTWTAAAIAGALEPGELLITGGYRSEPAPRGAYAPGGTVYHNSLVAVTPGPAGLKLVGLYDKHRLVPFGEYLPLDRELSPLGVHQLIHVGNGFTPGPAPAPLALAGAPPFQPLICYESLFPGFADASWRGNRRPGWLVNISDDAWFGVTSGPWQHLNLASYRAIEEGLPMVRATPTGISAVIDAYGRIGPGRMLTEGATGVIDARLPRATSPTFFARCGALSFEIMLLISLLFASWEIRATLRRNGDAS